MVRAREGNGRIQVGKKWESGDKMAGAIKCGRKGNIFQGSGEEE